MKRVIKWCLIAGGSLVVFLILALLLAPMFVDLQKYKPEIEKRVSEATGRPFTLGGDLELTLFPWAGVYVSDVRLGNPEGFDRKDFISLKSFEVKVKLIPLISKEVRIRGIRLERPRIVLIRRKDGHTNWEGLGTRPGGAPPPASKRESARAAGSVPPAMPIKSLNIGEIAITEGSALWIDRVKGERKKLSDLTLRLRDVSFERPIHLFLSAVLDGKPLSVEGDVGPVGKEPGKGTIPLNIALKALNQLDLRLNGSIKDPLLRPSFDVSLEVSPFSPRKLMAALGESFPAKTTDPKAFNKVALRVKAAGDRKHVSVSEGLVKLDDSTLTFNLRAREFSKPDVAFDINLDHIDLDRYLPPPGKENPKKAKPRPSEKKKIDYAPLRRLVVNGTIRVGKAKAHGARFHNLYMKVAGRNGLFHVDPLSLKLYSGSLSSHAALDVRKDIPKGKMELKAEGIQVNPLLNDLLEKDFLEGRVKMSVAVSMTGDDPDRIKRTLNGRGDFLFHDGAIKGVDLTSMVQNVKSAFGLAKKGEKVPRTDFSEFHFPFTIRNGVLDTRRTAMRGPLLRVLAAGKADLVRETLNFRVEPKFVATLKGQGDVIPHMGLKVPVLITGTFSSPKFRPDLSGMFGKGLMEEKQGAEKSESLTDKIKKLFKGLPFGR